MGKASRRKKAARVSPDQCLICKQGHHPLELPADAKQGPGWDDLRTAAMQDAMWHIAIGVWAHARSVGVPEDVATRMLTDRENGVMTAATYLAAEMHAAGRAYAMKESLEYAAKHAMEQFWSALVEVHGPGTYMFEVGRSGSVRRLN